LSGMTRKRMGMNHGIRYSEAFKLEAVRELEAGDLPYIELARKYGIKGSMTVHSWALKYGNGTRGKVTRVERPDEINELKQLKLRVRRLEASLADANIDAALERAYTRLACQRAGITDVAEFKKKAGGQPDMKP
jgi:transposase-like protein